VNAAGLSWGIWRFTRSPQAGHAIAPFKR